VSLGPEGVAEIHEWELSRRRRYYGLDGDATDAADHVLCVVSEKYLKAPYSSWERNSTQWDVVTGPPSLERFQIPRNQQAARDLCFIACS
jgi:hypothetical protein